MSIYLNHTCTTQLYMCRKYPKQTKKVITIDLKNHTVELSESKGHLMTAEMAVMCGG